MAKKLTYADSAPEDSPVLEGETPEDSPVLEGVVEDAEPGADDTVFVCTNNGPVSLTLQAAQYVMGPKGFQVQDPKFPSIVADFTRIRDGGNVVSGASSARRSSVDPGGVRVFNCNDHPAVKRGIVTAKALAALIRANKYFERRHIVPYSVYMIHREASLEALELAAKAQQAAADKAKAKAGKLGADLKLSDFIR